MREKAPCNSPPLRGANVLRTRTIDPEVRATREDRLAWPAAYAAFREVLPEMPEEQAKQETTHAIAFPAANHTKWFWGGVYG